MELNEFKEKFNSISLTDEKLQDYINYISEDVDENYTISQHVIICIEECSELQQTLTKLIPVSYTHLTLPTNSLV